MATLTRFVMVRHGETVANKQGLLQGWFESPLNENGRAQANCAATFLKDWSFDTAYSSDSSRAAETARIILQHHPDVTLNLTQSLREWHLGILEGRPQIELKQEYPDVIPSFKFEYTDPIVPGAERRHEFQKRINDFFMELTQKHLGETILICAHGGTMQRIFKMITGTLMGRIMLPLPDNASVSTMVFNNDLQRWNLETWNSKDHLKDLPTVQTLVY